MGGGPETAGCESCAGWWVRGVGTVLPYRVRLPRSLSWVFNTWYPETLPSRRPWELESRCSKSLGVVSYVTRLNCKWA